MSRYRLFATANGTRFELALTVAHLSMARQMAQAVADAATVVEITTLDGMHLETVRA